MSAEEVSGEFDGDGLLDVASSGDGSNFDLSYGNGARFTGVPVEVVEMLVLSTNLAGVGGSEPVSVDGWVGIFSATAEEMRVNGDGDGVTVFGLQCDKKLPVRDGVGGFVNNPVN